MSNRAFALSSSLCFQILGITSCRVYPVRRVC